jgi:hypothetical protein
MVSLATGTSAILIPRPAIRRGLENLTADIVNDSVISYKTTDDTKHPVIIFH